MSEHPEKKSVRFSIEDFVHDPEEGEESNGEGTSTLWNSPLPLAPTPSPTYSVSTLESSIGLYTPPDDPMLHLSHAKDASSSVGALEIRPSPSVPKLAPVLSSAVHLRWDMAEDPANIIKRLPLDGGDDRAGTMPSGEPMWRMHILHDALPAWPLTITSSKSDRVLTVHEVLVSIHLHLAKMVSREYFDEVTSDTERKEVYQRYKARVGLTSSATPNVGLQRIDYLPGKVFLGLQVRAGRNGEWNFILLTQ